MPIFRTGSKIIYFAHVPKTAGTAIEQYLLDRFGSVGFLDRHYLSIPPSLRWNRTSPQHVARNALDRLFPPNFFDASFALVRHPVSRLASVFLFQRDVQGNIADDTQFEDWVYTIPSLEKITPFHLDNHILPMSNFIPENAEVFHLENGLETVVDWIDMHAGCSDESVTLQKLYSYEQNMSAMQKPLRHITNISDALYAHICDLYADDMHQFGYEGLPPTSES